MPRPTPNREQQLLFNILKGETPTSLEGVDTAMLFELFKRHRLFPLAHQILPMLGEKERGRWKKAIRNASMRTLGFVGQLHELLDILNKEVIEVIPLKGPVLAEILYGDVNQRQMRDLDLLVTKDDMLNAIKVLQSAGYILKFPERELTKRQWKIYLRHQYDVGLVHRDNRSILELHSGIAYPGLLGGYENLIIDDMEAVKMSGRTIKSMSKEATFLYLVIHGTHHLFFRLFWLRDLAEALRRWELDHTRIYINACQMGIERMLGIALRLSASFFDIRIPSEYEVILKENENLLNQMEDRCRRAILDPEFLKKRNRLNVLYFSMAMKPGLRHKWRTFSSVYHRMYIRKFLAN